MTTVPKRTKNAFVGKFSVWHRKYPVVVRNGRQNTSAHALHQATRSKDLVRLFHKAGHCLSYEQVLQVDTSLAEFTLTTLDAETGAVIPPNMVENNFIHYTCDNINILDETLDGKILSMLRKWLPGSGVEQLSTQIML